MPERICERRDGQPKRAYATVQEAIKQIGYGYRYEPYECPEHGWHVGTRKRTYVWRMVAILCNKMTHIQAIIESPKGNAASKLDVIRRIVEAKGAYFDDPANLGKHASWPREAEQ